MSKSHYGKKDGVEVSKIILLVRTVNQKQFHIAGRTAEIRVTLKDLEYAKWSPSGHHSVHPKLQMKQGYGRLSTP